MNTLYIEKTEKSPWVKHDPQLKKISLGGRCLTHIDFWGPVRKAIKELCDQDLVETLSFELEYINDAAKTAIEKILREDTKGLPEDALSVVRNYDPEDDYMLTAGEVYGEIATRLPHIKAKRENVAIAA